MQFWVKLTLHFNCLVFAADSQVTKGSGLGNRQASADSRVTKAPSRDFKTPKNDLNKVAVESIFRDETMKGQAISKLHKKCYRFYFAERDRIFAIKMPYESPEKNKQDVTNLTINSFL